mgnify:FL=1
MSAGTDCYLYPKHYFEGNVSILETFIYHTADPLPMAIELADIHECVRNPLKLRIMSLLKHNGPMTAKRIQQETDAPQTTLYRALNVMQEAGILEVVSETKVRAMTEKTYGISVQMEHFDVDMVKSNDVQGYCGLFSTFMLDLMRDFQDYAEDPESDLRRDVTGFASTGLYLTDEQAREISCKVIGIIEPYLRRTSAEQKLHTLGFVLTPPQKRECVAMSRAGTIPDIDGEASE